MYHPFQLTVEGSPLPKNVLHPAGVRQNVGATSYGFDKLDLTHAHEPLVFKFVDLSHHRAIEAQENIPLQHQAP